MELDTYLWGVPCKLRILDWGLGLQLLVLQQSHFLRQCQSLPAELPGLRVLACARFAVPAVSFVAPRYGLHGIFAMLPLISAVLVVSAGAVPAQFVSAAACHASTFHLLMVWRPAVAFRRSPLPCELRELRASYSSLLCRLGLPESHY
jgi:hypothetical protein